MEYNVTDRMLWESHNIIDRLIESLQYFSTDSDDKQLIEEAEYHQRMLREKYLDIKE